MQKMKYKLYNRIIDDCTLSRLEIKLIFWLAAHQDERGRVQGVYFQDVADDLCCSISGFYITRDSLTEKGYIAWDKSYTADMDIRLIDNSFESDGEVQYRDYVDLNITMFNDSEFFKCKAGAIRTAMYFVKRVAAQGAITMVNSVTSVPREAENSRKLWFNPLKCIATLKKFLRVTSRMIKEYLNDISRWIGSVSVLNNGTTYTVITVLVKALKYPSGLNNYPERESYKQKVRMFIKRNNIDSTDKNMSDTADLIRQYKNIAKLGGLNITELLFNAISSTCSSVLNSINVHKSMRNLINYHCPGLLKG